jgi:hypothetical protein
MKTNQTMIMTIGGSEIAIEHKTKLGSLTQLWATGNSIRTKKGLTTLDMSHYLRSPETLELVQAIERKYGMDSIPAESAEIKNGRVATIKSPLIVTKRGRHHSGTWAHLYLLLDAASRLDADFKVMLYDILVNGNLLQWRDDSGDSYKALNIAIDGYLGISEVVNYIKVANRIREKIKPNNDAWNEANYQQLQQRTDIENKLISMLKVGLIKDINHLLFVIDRI